MCCFLFGILVFLVELNVDTYELLLFGLRNKWNMDQVLPNCAAASTTAEKAGCMSGENHSSFSYDDEPYECVLK